MVEDYNKGVLSARILYFDVIKGVSIILVVFCHFPTIPNESVAGNIFMTLAWAAVPCFMLVSGGLMHSKESFGWKNYFIKLGRTYFQVVCWRAAYLLIYMTFKEATFGKVALIRYLLFFVDIPGLNTGHLWFMNAYLTCMLLYPITYAFFNLYRENQTMKYGVCFILALTAIRGIIIPTLNWICGHISNCLNLNTLDWSAFLSFIPFSVNPFMIFYFLLGGILYNNHNLIRARMKSTVPLILSGIGLFSLVMVKFADTGSFVWGGKYVKDGYYQLATVLLACGVYYVCINFLSNGIVSKILALFGKNSLGIFYIHYIILSVCNTFIWPLLYGHGYYSFGLNCLKTFVISIISLVITLFLRKIPCVKWAVK